MFEENSKPRKLYAEVAEKLQAMILERALVPGDKLPSERELQASFGIGRPAVREALLLLERSGLIALRSGSPATVIGADPANIIKEMRVAVSHFLADEQGMREFQAVRKFLECGLARQAARMRDEESLARMRKILLESREVLDAAAAFETYDLAFHFAIVEISGSRAFNVVFEALSHWLREQRTMNFSLPGQTDIVYAEHETIYEAIAARDPDAAENAMRTHLDSVEKAYWAARERAFRRARAASGNTGPGTA